MPSRITVADRWLRKGLIKEMSELCYATRGSYGLTLKRGVTNPEDVTSLNLDPKTNICRVLKFSNNGQYLAYCDSSRTVVLETATGSELFAVDKTKTQKVEFSPRDSVLVTFEPYVVYGSRHNPDGTLKVPPPNVNVWSLSARRAANDRHLKQFIVTKQSTWRPQFSDDETRTIRQSDKGVFIYDNLDFDNGRNIAIKDLESFSVSPGITPYIMCFIPGLKGQPALLQLRELDDILTIRYSKQSFNCDKCTMNWNSKGNAVLVTASVDVDKSDKSYYGVSHLHCITTRFNSFQIYLDKEGPLHCVEWSPTGNQFCVCYGFMPSKVTIYAVNGDPLWEIGESYRNEIYYSPFGDILVTCAFGNISSGKMTFWNVETKKEIVEHEAPITTYFEWAPDGKHFVTATTAPRLRTDNGLRIWNYATGVVYEDMIEAEQVTWKPTKAFGRSEIAVLTDQQRAVAAANGLRSGGVDRSTLLDHLPAGAISKGGRYVPPALRKGGAGVVGMSAARPSSQPIASGQPATATAAARRPILNETEKRMKALQKKLDDIEKLKEKQEKSIHLELNQLEKIGSEAALREELQKLRVDGHV